MVEILRTKRNRLVSKESSNKRDFLPTATNDAAHFATEPATNASAESAADAAAEPSTDVPYVSKRLLYEYDSFETKRFLLVLRISTNHITPSI